MTAYTSTGTTGFWDGTGIWTGGAGYPGIGTGDTANFISGGYTITIGDGSTAYQFTVAGLQFDGAGVGTRPLLEISGATSAGELIDTGNLTVGGTGQLGEIELSNGGLLEVDGNGTAATAATGITINFADGNGDLLALGASSSAAGNPNSITGFAATITGFTVGDGIVLLNSAYVLAADPTLSDYTIVQHSAGLTVHNTVVGAPFGAPLFISGLKVPTLPTGQTYAISEITYGGTNYIEVVVACFLAGTHILTDRGEIAVENLREGDKLVTFSGRGDVVKPVTWIGQTRIDIAAHADPERALPVRIRAGAIAERMPHRDLLVSPDHAIYLDGVLIPAKHLINGSTITQDTSFEDVHYFHVELADHEILLAEGLPAETYLDTGNRDAFADLRPTLAEPAFRLPVFQPRA